MKKIILLLGFIFITVYILAIQVTEIKYMTEEYPPFNFSEKGKVAGFAVDILIEMVKEAGSKITEKDIKILPWARGYSIVKIKPNTCLFAMSRSKERDKLFKWVGPIQSSTVGIISKKTKEINITNYDDIKKYKIGTVIDDYSEANLIKNNVPTFVFDRMSDPYKNIEKLVLERIDGCAYGIESMKWILKQTGKNLDDYKVVFIYNKGINYYAFNKKTHDKVIKTLQEALERLKKSGKYQNIIDKYLK